MDAISLYIMQVKCNGIPPEYYEKAPAEEKRMLEERGGMYWLKEEFRKGFRVVATGGVFDILHVGHVEMLEEAKKHGDVLVVIVARDELAKKKGRVIHTQEERARILSSLRVVDVVVKGGPDVMETVKRVSPDVIVFGYDQKPFPFEGEVVQLKKSYKPETIKTGKIKDALGIEDV